MVVGLGLQISPRLNWLEVAGHSGKTGGIVLIAVVAVVVVVLGLQILPALNRLEVIGDRGRAWMATEGQ